jgi:SAM-dependent methyltransferase
MAERSGTLSHDPFRGRYPTSHERITGLPWDASYHGGPAPWDIGQPQPAVVGLASEGRFTGAVLDAGCGTGENALHIASLGLSVLGLDVAETALAIARKKASTEARGIELSLRRLTHSIWNVWGACSRQCWTADYSTASTATSEQDTRRV